MSQTIMVVDDDHSIRDIVVEILADEGYQARGYADGVEALGDLARVPPTLIVLDMRMPTLRDGDYVLWESNAICQYLASKKPESGLLPKEADAYFRAERVGHGDTLEQSFSIVLVTGGEGAIGEVPVRRGSTIVIPYAAGETQTQRVEGIRCLPPDPTAEATW